MPFLEPIIIFLFSIFGGAALLAIGLKYLGEAFQILFKGLYQWLFQRISNNPLVNMIAGGFISFLGQSHVANSYLVVNYTNAGLLKTRQSVAIMTASALPVALTLWLLAYKWGWLELLFLGVGAYPTFFARNERLVAIGRLVLGIGLLFLANRLMLVGLESQTQLAYFISAKYFSTPDNFITISLSFLLAMLGLISFRSLLIALVIVLNLFEADYINEYVAAYMIAGANFAAFLPATLSWPMLSQKCKRAIGFQLILQLFAAIIVVLFINNFVGLGQSMLKFFGTYSGMDAKDVVSVLIVPIMHVLFVLLAMACFVVLFFPLLQLMKKLVPNSSTKEQQKLRLIGDVYNASPMFAIDLAHQEVRKMAAMVDTMLQLTAEMLGQRNFEKSLMEKILKYESVTDNLQKEMTSYLTKIMQLSLTQIQGEQVRFLIRTTKELESIADCCKAIYYLHQSIVDSKEHPDPEVVIALKTYFADVLNFYELLFADLADDDESVFNNKIIDETYRAKSVDIQSQYTQLLRECNTKLKATHSGQVFPQIAFKLDLIFSYTINIYESYRSVEI